MAQPLKNRTLKSSVFGCFRYSCICHYCTGVTNFNQNSIFLLIDVTECYTSHDQLRFSIWRWFESKKKHLQLVLWALFDSWRHTKTFKVGYLNFLGSVRILERIVGVLLKERKRELKKPSFLRLRQDINNRPLNDRIIWIRDFCWSNLCLFYRSFI